MDHKRTRREILGEGSRIGGALIGSTALAGISADAQAAAAQQMPHRVLGRTGKKISILGMGGSMVWDRGFDPKLPEVIRQGVTYIDAARSYAGGNNELAIGRFLARSPGVRKQLWITSKSHGHSPEEFERDLDTSLRAMQTDHVDMYMVHGAKDPALFSSAMKQTVEKLRKAGKLIHFGFSCHADNVAELLQLAARTTWVDAVMFRYNFREYGDKALNQAMDACHKAGTGLIAMKTQGSSVSFESRWQKFEQTGKWNRHQAVLKAVWADERLSGAVSEMDTMEKIKENVAAALDKKKLGMADWKAIEKYAAATRNQACGGCEHLCNGAAGGAMPIGTTLRYLMYHDSYGKVDDARRLFRELPENARSTAGSDLQAAARACPRGLDIPTLVRRAHDVLT